MALEADYVVVGGGTAGCVVASRLAQAAHSVILLEAGPDEHDNPLISSPAGGPRLHRTELEWNYMTEPQTGLDGRQIYNCTGKVLSGSSAVNYGMWTRGAAADFDDWATATGDPRWSYRRLLPYFRRSETYQGPGDAAQHGADGPIYNQAGGRRYVLSDVLQEALHAAGHQDNPDGNNGSPLGISPWTEAVRNGKRQAAGNTYPMAGVQVRTRCLVRRILLADETPPRAIGAELASDETVHAKREVIVACGALRSPQVLLQSGIGPPAELSRQGIPLRVANEGVGANFRDHVSMIQFWRLAPTLAAQGASMGSAGFAARPDATTALPFDNVTTASVPTAVLTAACADDKEAAEYLMRDPPRPHIELLWASTVLGRGNPAHSAPVDGSHVSSGVLLLTPTSKGSIRLADRKDGSSNTAGTAPDPAADPAIDPAYLSTTPDIAMIRAGVRAALRVAHELQQRGAIEAETPPVGFPPLDLNSSDADIDARVRRFAATMYHPCGSVAMGAALDSSLRVHGVQALRVIDASAFPLHVAAHIQQAVYALAERGADFVLGREADVAS